MARRGILSKVLLVGVVLALALSLSACTDDEPSKIILASTTSTQDSGLFDVIIPAFEEAEPDYYVEVVAVGTGAALEMGERKDADVLLVHAKTSEEEFVAEGYGTERRDVMYNDFIIVGPASDPAGLSAVSDIGGAFEALSTSGEEFVSRGDDSGTHKKELSIWDASGIAPEGDWYVEAGQGMGDCLTMASERLAYVMCDRATYLKMSEILDLEIAFEGDPLLFNQYGVLPVTDATNMSGAEAFADWICGEEAQELISTYGQEEFGQPLFVPNA